MVLGGGASSGGVATVGTRGDGAGASTLGSLFLLLVLLLGLDGYGGCRTVTLRERFAQNLGEVVIRVAQTVQNIGRNIGVAGVQVRIVATLNGPACAPGLRVSLTGPVIRVSVPVHGLVLQRGRGGSTIQAAAGNHNGTATVAPGLRLSVQLVGDEFCATGVAHGPHIGGVHTVCRDKRGGEGAEELAVAVHIFPPGDAAATTVGIRGDNRHEEHILCCGGGGHPRQLTGGVVNLGLVIAPVVAVEVEDHAHGLREVHAIRVHVVLRGGAGRRGVGEEGLVGADCV